MLRKTIRFLSIPLGAVCGIGVALLLIEVLEQYLDTKLSDVISKLGTVILIVSFAIISTVIFYILSKRFTQWIFKTMASMEKNLSKLPIKDLMVSTIGLIVGLLIAFLLGQAIGLLNSPIISITANVILYSILGIMGVRVAHSRKDEVPSYFFKKRGSKNDPEFYENVYLLDASIIIDGRIVDIISLGFINGTIIIPSFIVNDLRRLADSDDELKHAKGRRGLDILTRLQAEDKIVVDINKSEIEGNDTDERLLKLAGLKNATLITNDYNLNKVAQVHGVKILNLNDLSNALKPILIPGEDIQLLIVKEGKEQNQGVAYLDDGTMIVIENGRHLVGKQVKCVVTSVLQTSAGRLIFAKVKE